LVDDKELIVDKVVLINREPYTGGQMEICNVRYADYSDQGIHPATPGLFGLGSINGHPYNRGNQGNTMGKENLPGTINHLGYNNPHRYGNLNEVQTH
jgi:hypothetical protein